MSLRTLLQRFRRPAPAGGEILAPVSRAHPVGTATLLVLPDTSALRPPLPQRPPATPQTRARLHLEVAVSQSRAALADIIRWADCEDPAEARVRHVAACHQLDAAQTTLDKARRALLKNAPRKTR